MVKYIFAIDPNPQLGLGVQNKIDGQIATLNSNGIYTIKAGFFKPSKIIRLLPFNTSSIRWKDIDLSNVDGLYIRYNLSDYQFIRFLKKAKKKGIKIAIEIASYPYQNRMKLFNIKTIRDYIYRSFLHKYVDHIFYISEEKKIKSIWGISCSRIFNGINFDNYRNRKVINKKDSIRLIAVADFQFFHGYERVLRGLSEYYKGGGKRRIDFFMVGNGAEKKYYENLVCDLGLSEFVHFTGVLKGEALDRMFDNSDIGVEVFGLYKRKLKVSSSLKSREYLARGIPFICGAKNDVIDEDFSYSLFFENDSSIVDMNRVVEFYDKIVKDFINGIDVPKEIRAYGIQRAGWNATFKPVVNFFSN